MCVECCLSTVQSMLAEGTSILETMMLNFMLEPCLAVSEQLDIAPLIGANIRPNILEYMLSVNSQTIS